MASPNSIGMSIVAAAVNGSALEPGQGPGPVPTFGGMNPQQMKALTEQEAIEVRPGRCCRLVIDTRLEPSFLEVHGMLRRAEHYACPPRRQDAS